MALFEKLVPFHRCVYWVPEALCAQTLMCRCKREAEPCSSALHWSTFLTRSTTGTEVQGIMPKSVITRSTKSGGVTSYTRFRSPSELTFCQFSRWVFPFLVTIRSSGSSVKKIICFCVCVNTYICYLNKISQISQSYLIHWIQKSQSALVHRTCRSHSRPALVHCRLLLPGQSGRFPHVTSHIH